MRYGEDVVTSKLLSMIEVPDSSQLQLLKRLCVFLPVL